MTVLKRGKSKFWYIQFRQAGRTIIRSSRTTSRRIAEQIEIRMRAEAHAEKFLGQKRRVRLSDALVLYERSKQGTANFKNLPGHIRSVGEILGRDTFLDAITTGKLDRYCEIRARGGVGPQTLKHALSVLRGTIDLHRKRGFQVPDLVFPTIKVPVGRLRYLSPAEETALLAALDPNRIGPGLYRSHNHEPELRAALQDLHDLVILLLDLGARCGEIRRLKWTDIDLTAGVLRLWRPKVRNESLLYMTVRVRDVLERRQLKSMSRFVFANRAGEMRGHSHSAWRKAFNRAGLHDCTIHSIRHTHASRLIQNGLSVYEVQTILGHSDPKTTMRYAHLESAKVAAKARDIIESLPTSCW